MMNPHIFEGIMIACFGIAWPFSILRLLRAKTAEGKSFLFLVVILSGYISGIIFNLTIGPNLVLILYVFNTLMVSIDLALTCHYHRLAKQTSNSLS